MGLFSKNKRKVTKPHRILIYVFTVRVVVTRVHCYLLFVCQMFGLVPFLLFTWVYQYMTVSTDRAFKFKITQYF